MISNMSEPVKSEQSRQQSATKPKHGVLGHIFSIQDEGFKRRLEADSKPWDGSRIDSSPDMDLLMESVRGITK